MTLAKIEETRQKILDHFEKNQWEIPDVANALGITEQYLRKILNNPENRSPSLPPILFCSKK